MHVIGSNRSDEMADLLNEKEQALFEKSSFVTRYKWEWVNENNDDKEDEFPLHPIDQQK